MARESDAAIQRFADALVAGDLGEVRSFLASDYYGHRRNQHEPSQADRWAALLPDVLAAVPDLHIGLEGADLAEASPGEVGVHAVISGTHANELWGSPGTGRQIRLGFRLRFRPTAEGWLIQGEDPPSMMIAALRAVGVVPPAEAMHLEPADPIAPPEFLLKIGFTGEAADKRCIHLADARVFEPATDVCAECVAADGFWAALRMCLACGAVGCCDTSLSRHARAHYEGTGHPVMRSVRLRERWLWCYEDEALFEGATLERLAAAAGAPLGEG
jgi:hypothetical protein